MTLSVRTTSLRTGDWGWNKAGGVDSRLNRRLGVADGEPRWMKWTLDPDELVGRDQDGRTVRLAPFLGVIGLPPAEPGEHSTTPPRNCGGNLDCKELVIGSTLYLPITVTGALLSVGDGHAAQGDGEVSGTAIECPMTARLNIDLHTDTLLPTPWADTPNGFVTFGFDPTLDEAMAIALDGMLSLMAAKFSLDRRTALALASVAVDLRITQVVNEIWGVHALLRTTDHRLFPHQPGESN
jgi:acetamidase/formamidase